MLTARWRVIEQLQGRLDYHFDVRMLTAVFVEWAEAEVGPHWDVVERGIVKFEIGVPAARIRAAELDELKNLEERHGSAKLQLSQH